MSWREIKNFHQHASYCSQSNTGTVRYLRTNRYFFNMINPIKTFDKTILIQPITHWILYSLVNLNPKLSVYWLWKVKIRIFSSKYFFCTEISQIFCFWVFYGVNLLLVKFSFFSIENGTGYRYPKILGFKPVGIFENFIFSHQIV